MDESKRMRRTQADAERVWEMALDKPGTADQAHVRWSFRATVIIVATACVMVFYGGVPLRPFPQFTIMHATVIFMTNAVTGILLLGQFRYRRLPSYLILAAAYLFGALVAVPFLLSFPGAVVASGSVIGGMQSSIWVWHFWHILFPVLVIASLATHVGLGDSKVPSRWVITAVAAMLFIVGVLEVAVTEAVTVFHDSLPVLIDADRHPVANAFYVAGGAAGVLTFIALILAWRLARRRSILYVWLLVVLVAFLSDVAVSLGAGGRYTVGWYGGRIEAMVASSILLPVFLGEINLLYQQLAETMGKLAAANHDLLAMIREKDQVMATLRAREDEVRQLAYYDTLTNLPNRRLLYDRLHQALAQAKHFSRSLAVMFLDLDHFKEINDTLGHDVGDELLKQVAGRWSACIRSGDTLCRVGGDEFVIILTEIHQPHDAALVAEKAVELVNQPFSCLGHPIKVTTSIGIAVYPIDGPDNVQDLMKKADTAMYTAKQGGRNRYQFFAQVAG
jgi:diguanylate cyclase (GGDEF)-like protein